MKLIWVNFSHFRLKSEEGFILSAGSLKTVVKTMISLGISFDEIDTAVGVMAENDHNLAEFGTVNRTFLYTDYSGEYDTLQATA